MMGNNMPDMGPYAELERVASIAFEEAKHQVSVTENRLECVLKTILDHDTGAKTTALARAKGDENYQKVKLRLLDEQLDMRLKEGEVRAAKTSFEEWRTKSSNKRAQMTFNR